MHRNRVRPAADTPTHPPPPRHRARTSKIHHSYPTPIRSWGRRVPLLARCENFRTEEGIEEAKHQRTLTASRSHRAATPDSSGESSEVSEASVESDGGDPPDALDSPDVTTPAGLGAVQNVVQQTLISVSWNNTGGQGRHRCHRRRDPV
ncbi:hypothetical protein PC128_g25075 [Phytophthora cactorum]|nr:hypothetical protein PC128_g25075 [Phytophthora cactorum]